jgi:hypothetical protein
MVKARRKRKRRSLRRKIKSRSRKKPSKQSEVKLIVTIILVFMVVLPFVVFIFNQLIQSEFEVTSERKQPVNKVAIQDTSGGACKRNIECFSVSCKSDIENLKCVNTDKMVVYYENCEAYWDVNVEKQDFSECACIGAYCRVP